jgi:hypothetical protein
MNRKIKIFLIVLLLLTAGFLRESFFRNLNAWIDFKSGISPLAILATTWEFISEMSVETLSNLKWIATLLFAGIFYVLTLTLVKILFPKSNNRIYVTITYLGVLVLAAISILAGNIFPGIYSITYYFSRWLMGTAQSPLLPSIICILILYSNLDSSRKDLPGQK